MPTAGVGGGVALIGFDKGLPPTQPAKGLTFHSDIGSQYTSNYHQNTLQSFSIRSGMESTRAC